MTIVAFSGEQQYREYLKGRIRDARAALSKLPTLQTLVDDFKPLENAKRIHNVVFWKCAWASGIGGQPDILSLAELNELEDFLRELNVLNWPSAKKNAIATKLQSNTLNDGLAGYTEMTIAGNLAKKLGGTQIEYEPALSSGGFGDIRLEYSSQPIYVEVTALNTRETERKFTEIFDQVAEYVWSQINQDICVHIDIDTGVLPSSSEGIDVDVSVKMIANFLKATNLISIFANGFSVHGIKHLAQLDPNRTLYDQKEMLQHYSTKLYENIEAEPIHSFAKTVTAREFINCPVVSFWCVLGEQRVVEIADQKISPSAVSSLERKAFLRHVVRKLKEELNQMQRGEINIIVLKASNWSVLGYEKGKVEADFTYDALRSMIEKFMQDAAIPDLSAVVVYEEKFASAQIVMNPASSDPSKTTYEFIEKIVR
jgi:hypothetical protein